MPSRLIAVLVSLIATGCTAKTEAPADSAAAQGVSAAPVDRTAEAATIVRADSAWMRHIQSKSVDSLMTWYTSDAVSYGFGAPATGTDQIRSSYTEFVKATIADPRILSNTVKISDDGNMAYDHGTYTMTVTQPGGKPTKYDGAYLNVWRKVDGQWKLAAEMSTPMAPPK